MPSSGTHPFSAPQHIRGAFGDDYVDWLKRAFGVGVKDFCTYWFRKAHDHLLPGQRAGLVGTNSISQNRARSVSLDYIVANGGMITDAISSQKWPGEAKVHVSLVNWVKASDAETLTLDGVEVSGIDSSLHVNTPGAWTPATFPGNKGRCFQGPIPVGGGFIITEAEAKSMLGLNQPDYREVIRPYLTSEDIAELPNSSPSRWVIDFGSGTLESSVPVSGGTGPCARAGEARTGCQQRQRLPPVLVAIRTPANRDARGADAAKALRGDWSTREAVPGGPGATLDDGERCNVRVRV